MLPPQAGSQPRALGPYLVRVDSANITPLGILVKPLAVYPRAMQGLVFLGDRRVAIQDFPDPVPGQGDVVVAIRASGMCGSDLPGYVAPSAEEAASDPARRIIKGHEPCGVVAERGPGVTEAQAPTGQRVMVHHYRGCGACTHCRAGYTPMCALGSPVM